MRAWKKTSKSNTWASGKYWAYYVIADKMMYKVLIDDEDKEVFRVDFIEEAIWEYRTAPGYMEIKGKRLLAKLHKAVLVWKLTK